MGASARLNRRFSLPAPSPDLDTYPEPLRAEIAAHRLAVEAERIRMRDRDVRALLALTGLAGAIRLAELARNRAKKG